MRHCCRYAGVNKRRRRIDGWSGVECRLRVGKGEQGCDGDGDRLSNTASMVIDM